jgi:hypothetical protein
MQYLRFISVIPLLMSLLIAAPATAAGIEGIYSAQGTNPGGRGHYKGTATIKRTGNTYKIVWNVGSVFIGTGIVTDNVFSVSYTDEHKKWFGTVSYRIEDGGDTLKGSWCEHGGRNVGSELLIKRR